MLLLLMEEMNSLKTKNLLLCLAVTCFHRLFDLVAGAAPGRPEMVEKDHPDNPWTVLFVVALIVSSNKKKEHSYWW
jgi:hypothetical protein